VNLGIPFGEASQRDPVLKYFSAANCASFAANDSESKVGEYESKSNIKKLLF